MLMGNKLVFDGIFLVQVMILSSTAYALKVNTEHVRYTDFSDGTKSPYKDCTTQRPNYVRVEEMDGDRVAKLYWTQTGYDGTRMDKGAEGCSKLEIYKEGWQAYKVYLPDPGFPKNKTGSISQIFSLGGCSSWAAMPVVKGNRLTLVHRASCGKAEDAILLEDIPRNEWIQMIYHFRVSQKNDGFLRVWIETLDNIDALDQNKPLFEHIGNFGFGLWDSNDVLQVRPSSDRTNWTDLKFGMYNHSSRDYDQDEERWLFYDDMMNINGNPENAFLMSQGYVNEQGLYDSDVSIKKAISSQVLGEPTNEAEAAEKRVSESERIERLYQAKKATLSPERLAWEILLEENLGNDFYLPIHKRDFVNGVSTGWDFVADDPNLPRVLLIGDSISRGYTLPTRKVLAGKANVHRAPENCRHTANGIQKLDMWLGTKKWDVIHFNFGIHDRRTPIPEYINRLTQIVTRLQATGATLIWATTTPVPYDPKKEQTDTSIVERNAAAAVLMEKHSIAINDLYTAIKPHLATLQKPKQDVHFKAAGNEFLANRVAEAIQSKILTGERIKGF